MRAAIIIVLVILCFTKIIIADELNEYLGKVNISQPMFSMSDADLAMLDELNTMRKLIAQGFFNDPFKNILEFAFDGVVQLLRKGAQMLEDGAAAIAEFGMDVYDVGKKALAWGSELLNSGEAINEISKGYNTVVDAGSNFINNVKSGNILPVPSFLGRRKKRFLDTLPRFISDASKAVKQAFNKPKNVFGPATNMNMLTWNRRLSQLAMVEKKNIETEGLKRIEYKGKMYRINKYGTLATYVINSTLGGFIADLFQIVRVGYLACKLWFAGFKIPTNHENTTIGETHEMLFADRTEVGCFFTWPNTICIIGPLNATFGHLYEGGGSCKGCKYGCTNYLCNPSPEYFYAMREKYQKHLKPKIEQFEIVEGFDGAQPVLGKNFMIDAANYSNVLMISILLVSLFLLLCNKL